MCVAIMKPAGVKAPTLEILRACWDANPDGAGVAVSERNAVRVHKGFMTFADFEKFYTESGLENKTGQAMLLHFRIGTHGPKDAGNTHPFPVSADPVVLRSVTGRYPMAIVHNGIFNNDIDKNLAMLSDTGQFLVDCSRAGKHPEAFWNANPKTTGWSRMAVLEPHNVFTLLGEWKVDTEKSGCCYYSNLTWKFRIHRASSASSTEFGFGANAGKGSGHVRQLGTGRSFEEDEDWQVRYGAGFGQTIGDEADVTEPFGKTSARDLLTKAEEDEAFRREVARSVNAAAAPAKAQGVAFTPAGTPIPAPSAISSLNEVAEIRTTGNGRWGWSWRRDRNSSKALSKSHA